MLPVAAVVLQWGLLRAPHPVHPAPTQSCLSRRASGRMETAGSGHGSSLQCCSCTNSSLAPEQL